MNERIPQPLGIPQQESLSNRERDSLLYRFRTEFLLPLLGWEMVGEGAECLVIAKKERPELLIAYSTHYISQERAETIFHTHRILSTLFPHNFPKIHSAFPSTTTSLGGTTRERVQKGEERKDPVYPFARVNAVFEELAIPFGVDANAVNFIVGEDGGQYWIDTTPHLGAAFGSNAAVLLSYMEAHSFSEEDIQTVASSLQALRALYKLTY